MGSGMKGYKTERCHGSNESLALANGDLNKLNFKVINVHREVCRPAPSANL